MLEEYELLIENRLENCELIVAKYWICEYTKCINSFKEKLSTQQLVKYATKVGEYEKWLERQKKKNVMNL
jgi:hypothetical protein